MKVKKHKDFRRTALQMFITFGQDQSLKSCILHTPSLFFAFALVCLADEFGNTTFRR